MKSTLIKLESKETIRGKRYRSFMFSFFQAAICLMSGLASYKIVYSKYYSADEEAIKIAMLLLLSTVVFMSVSVVKQGREAWHCCLSNRKEPSFLHVLYWIKPSRGMRSFLLSVSVAVRKIFWLLMFSIPGNVLILIASVLRIKGEIELDIFWLTATGGMLSLTVGLFFAFCINQRYFMTKYLLAKYPKKRIKDAIKESISLMNGKCARVATFKMSFLPLMMLCLLVIPCVHVLPYYNQSCVCLKREISGSSF